MCIPKRLLAPFALFSLAIAATGIAHAGQCRDPWVTRAIEQVTRHAPTGYGNYGDCNIYHYGHGHWSSYADLVNKVHASYRQTYAAAAMIVAGNGRDYCLIGTSNQFQTTSCSTADNVFTRTYYFGPNAFTIRVRGWCLDARAGMHRPVTLTPCNGSKTQDWWLDSTGQIQNQRFTNGCMDVSGGVGDNRRLLLWNCDYMRPVRNRKANQRFLFGEAKYAPADRAVLPSSYQSLLDRRIAAFSSSAGVITAGAGNVISAGAGN